MTYLDESEISTLSDSQEKAMAVLTLFSATLSLIGSFTLLGLIRKKALKRARQRPSSTNSNGNVCCNYWRLILHVSPYHRILAAMAVWDIIFTVQVSFQPFLVPKETSQQVWAVGNDKTCSAIGFLNQISFAAFFYNGALSLYYVFTIRGSMPEAILAKRVEPWLHFVCNFYPLVTGIIGAILGVYRENELGPGCWVNNYPENCGTDPTETGEPCLSVMIAYVFAGIPIMLLIFMVAVNNILIVRHVRRTIQNSLKYSQHHLPVEGSSMSMASSSWRSRAFSTRGGGGGGVPQRSLGGSIIINNSSSNPGGAARTVDLAPGQRKRIQIVGSQSVLYVVAFLGSQGWIMLVKIIEGASLVTASENDKIYPIMVVANFLVPLQGFFNLLIYLRPNYLRNRDDYPNESRWWACRRTLFGNRVKRTGVGTQRNSRPFTTSASRDSSNVDVGPLFRIPRERNQNITTINTINDDMEMRPIDEEFEDDEVGSRDGIAKLVQFADENPDNQQQQHPAPIVEESESRQSFSHSQFAEEEEEEHQLQLIVKEDLKGDEETDSTSQAAEEEARSQFAEEEEEEELQSVVKEDLKGDEETDSTSND